MDVVRLPVITGCTAAGKSALAMEIAARYAVTIISADSRQIYRGFDKGTAKPSSRDLEVAPHEGIDVAEPHDRFSAARWAALAGAAVERAIAQGRRPLVVGGSGLYLKALFEPLFSEPQLDPVARAALQAELALESTEGLRRQVMNLDPPRAHLGRTQLLRAIEVALLTGTPISEWHKTSAKPAMFGARYLIADASDELGQRIAARTTEMLRSGWVDEARLLMESVAPDAPAWKATGYRTVCRMVRGEIGLSEGTEEIVIHTRQYAKRQRTWMRHQLPADVRNVDTTATSKAVDQALGWWTEEESI